MVDPKLDAVRREFADLTGLFEDAALLDSEGQGVKALDGGRSQLRRISKMVRQIRRRLLILEGLLQ